jgi:tetratricopeptide (TPR) repeat protein
LFIENYYFTRKLILIRLVYNIHEFKKKFLFNKKLNPRYSEAWKGIGNIFFDNNQTQNATKYYQRALECNPNDNDAKLGLANCLYLIEQFDSAIKLYEEVAASDPNDEVEYNLANCYYMKGEIDEAIYHYE